MSQNKEEVLKYLDAVRDKIIQCGGTFDDVARNAALVNYCSTTLPTLPRIEELETKTTNHEDRIVVLEQKVEALCRDLQEAHATNGRLAKQLEGSRRYWYAYNVLIMGISELPCEQQAQTEQSHYEFRKFVLSCLKKYDNNLRDEDFELAHRLGKHHGSSTNPRPIVVKMFSREVARRLINASYNARGTPNVPTFIIKQHRPLPLCNRTRGYMQQPARGLSNSGGELDQLDGQLRHQEKRETRRQKKPLQRVVSSVDDHKGKHVGQIAKSGSTRTGISEREANYDIATMQDPTNLRRSTRLNNRHRDGQGGTYIVERANVHSPDGALGRDNSSISGVINHRGSQRKGCVERSAASQGGGGGTASNRSVNVNARDSSRHASIRSGKEQPVEMAPTKAVEASTSEVTANAVSDDGEQYFSGHEKSFT